MDSKHKEVCRTLQILLWLWFGLTTSFIATNVVNIARLETQIKLIETDNKMFKNHIQLSKECYKK